MRNLALKVGQHVEWLGKDGCHHDGIIVESNPDVRHPVIKDHSVKEHGVSFALNEDRLTLIPGTFEAQKTLRIKKLRMQIAGLQARLKLEEAPTQ